MRKVYLKRLIYIYIKIIINMFHEDDLKKEEKEAIITKKVFILSETNNKKELNKEWDKVHCEINSNHERKCLCGKPMKKIVHMFRNNINNNVIELGSTCVKYFIFGKDKIVNKKYNKIKKIIKKYNGSKEDLLSSDIFLHMCYNNIENILENNYYNIFTSEFDDEIWSKINEDNYSYSHNYDDYENENRLKHFDYYTRINIFESFNIIIDYIEETLIEINENKDILDINYENHNNRIKNILNKYKDLKKLISDLFYIKNNLKKMERKKRGHGKSMLYAIFKKIKERIDINEETKNIFISIIEEEFKYYNVIIRNNRIIGY